MAKKSKPPHATPRQRAMSRPRRWYQKKPLFAGGVILGLVIGIGLFVRYHQQSQLAPRLQGAIDNHYTKGVAGAPVVIKEFSDYG